MLTPIKSNGRTIGYTEERLGKITVYDGNRRRIGEISKSGSKLVATDTRLKKIAEYDERMDITYDDRARRIGRGNMLAETLLKNSPTSATRTPLSNTDSDLTVQKNLSGRKPIKDRFSRTIGYIDDSRSTIIVYNARNLRIGEIRKEGSRLVAKDSRLRTIAEYDERTNETKDAHFKKLGRGNMLIELLLKNG